MAGTTSRTQGSDTAYHVEKCIIHEAYNKLTKNNDIGLVRVDRDIQFNDKVQPIKLAKKRTSVDDNESVILTGWGKVNLVRQSCKKKAIYKTQFLNL